MSLSDRFRDIWNKEPSKEPAGKPPARSQGPAKNTPPPPVPTPPSPPSPIEPPPSREEKEKQLAQEKAGAENRIKAIDKDILDLHGTLEKTELAARNRRDAQQQTLQFLQQDAEREINFLERKLEEDLAAWNRQLAEREKAIDTISRQAESGQLEKKNALEETSHAQQESLERTEQQLKEQESKLAQERQKWRDLLRAKEDELLTVKQELTRREAELEKELHQLENQRKSAQELWETRLKELERQWAEKRKTWEEAMKAKEEERLRIHSTFQEQQAAWQLDQERLLQEMGRRQERATDKISALKAHLVKETQSWQELSQAREEQLQQLKVKLMLSETDAKAQVEQAQKTLHESVAGTAAQVQTLQKQILEEQKRWQKELDAKDGAIASLKNGFRGKLRQIEATYSKRIGTLGSEKESLTNQYQMLQTQYDAEKKRFDERLQQIKTEQETLQSTHTLRMADLKKGTEDELTTLQTQMNGLEKQKEDAERELEAVRLRWQQELAIKDQALKEIQNVVGPQEAELRKRFSTEEEVYTRQIEALKTRVRALERDLARMPEAAEKVDKDYASAAQALEKDHKEKEEALQRRTGEQMEKLRSRLHERKLSLEAFLLMKKDEESKIQKILRLKEKERAELASRLQTLPQDLEKALKEKKDTVQKDSDVMRARIAALEAELVQAREQSKSLLQTKATELAGLRQALDMKHKDLAADIKSREQTMEAERAGIEKQLATAQAETDRVRSHWQIEIDKKEHEIAALQDQLRQQEQLHHQTLEQEKKNLEQPLAPLELQREDLARILEQERTEHEQKQGDLDRQSAETQTLIRQHTEQEKTERAALETRFRQERAHFKTKLDTLHAEQQNAVQSAQEMLSQKTLQIEQIEEQMQAQVVAHDTRRRELTHNATVKTRTLQELIEQITSELKQAQETFPKEMQAKEDTLNRLNEELAAQQRRHQTQMARIDRAFATMTRRARQKEEVLRTSLAEHKDEWAKKLSARDSEIAGLQSDLMAKEAERQAELDRLAKQFAEERFQLEKTKEEVEWKLKDQKEVSERQLAGKQKEMLFLESELQRAKAQRDQELAAKTAAFDTEKQKFQGILAHLQEALQEERKTQEDALLTKEKELQGLIVRSKQRLHALGDEFNQKVSSWRATNEALRNQIEQLKTHVAEAQVRWDALRKEKADEISALRQDLTQCELGLQNDRQALERAHDLDRQTLLTQIRKLEQDITETKALSERRLTEKDEEMQQAKDQIGSQESAAEAEWRATLEQWQSDKQSLYHEKIRLEQDLQAFQNRTEQELRQIDETSAKLRMDITFQESEVASQQDRLRAQFEKELSPLRDKIESQTADMEQHKITWESQLRVKEDDLKTVKTRLAAREKRLRDETRRRQKEIDFLQKQVTAEREAAQSRYTIEKERLDSVLQERRALLAQLEARENAADQAVQNQNASTHHTLQKQRQELEESLRGLVQQRELLQKRFEQLLQEKDSETQRLNQELEEKDAALNTLHASTRQEAEGLRREIDQLRQLVTRPSVESSSTKNAAAWSAFESGVNFYQAHQWEKAAQCFEQCLANNPHWGAAYQYLALSHQACGDDARALDVAARALQEDPGNAQLGTWVERLRAAINQKKAS